MKIYKAKVRLNGQVANEVRKTHLTAAEIVVLQRKHGDDAVSDVVEIGRVKRSDAKERDRLAEIYRSGLDAGGKERLEGRAFIDSVFGAGGVPLPQEYAAAKTVDEEEFAGESEREEVELFDKTVVRTKVTPVEEVADLTA